MWLSHSYFIGRGENSRLWYADFIVWLSHSLVEGRIPFLVVSLHKRQSSLHISSLELHWEPATSTSYCQTKLSVSHLCRLRRPARVMTAVYLILLGFAVCVTHRVAGKWNNFCECYIILTYKNRLLRFFLYSMVLWRMAYVSPLIAVQTAG